MKIKTTDLFSISSHKYLRIDIKYWKMAENVFLINYEKIKDVFYIVNGSSCTEYYSAEITSIPFVRIGDLSYKFPISTDNMIYLDDECEIQEYKRLKPDDLILATIGATVGKIGLADALVGGTFSNNVAVLRVKNESMHFAKFYEKLLQTDFYKNYIFGVVSQKAQPNLQTYDLQNIKLPIVHPKIQAQCIEKISPIEKRIKRLKDSKKSIQKIIDKILERELKLNITEALAVDCATTFFMEFGFLDNYNSNLRCSYRWNKLEQIQTVLLRDVPSVEKLGKFIYSTKNGWSPLCTEDASTYSVIGIDAINKDGVLTFNNPKFTNETKNNVEDFIVKEGDFFVSRGNTTDLVALASIAPQELLDEYIYPDLMIKIDFDQEVINKEYLAYIINSIVGRLYFKFAAKGKNQTMVKISSTEINDFLLPVPDIKLQQRIVAKIKAEIDKQNIVNDEISQLRDSIDRIVEDAIVQ